MEFVERATRYADTAAAFAEAHHVFDEGPLWRERVRQTNVLLGELDRIDELPDDLAAVAHEVARELDDRVPMG